jgi:uncharacterized protein (TIGR00375 family)
MKIIADLHIHSRFSRATSKQLDIPSLEKYARLKGLSLLGTGDFTHPKWFSELKQQLHDDGTGFLKTGSGFNFVLQTEVSLIYTQDNKGRRIHNVVLAPSLDVAEQVTEYLKTKGRVDYDGRPIFKIPCPEFVESLTGISPDLEIIPAHIWTPWFSLFGSKSGFNSMKECYKDQTGKIHAIETGLSSDPAMNWRVSELDKLQIMSSSDSHSFWPWRMGREATIFDIEPNYKSLIEAIRTGDKLEGTIEVDPNYGKYHYDGHRQCHVVLSPQESIRNNDICPVCKRPLTIGVMHRVEELADRQAGFKPRNAKPYHALVPLSELIAAKLHTTVASRQVWQEHHRILAEGTEFDALIFAPEDELAGRTDQDMLSLILQNRASQLFIRPGYDGVYGELVLGGTIAEPVLKHKPRRVQTGLSEFMHT